MGKVGVVIARFQVPDLHEGHKDIIDMAVKENDKLLIILGNSHLLHTMLDPLDYQTRVKMLQSHYPDAIVTFVRNQETDEKWSEAIDKTIAEICPLDKPTLYGGRDSFIPYYEPYGKHKCREVTSFHESSGTELREAAGQVVLDTPDFRKGVIYAAYNRYPNIRVTVDMAVVNNEWTDPIEAFELLLGRKHNSDNWRLPGGFVDIKDESFEQTARRELMEEAPGMEVGDWHYVGSYRVEDWRYEGVDGEYIMTNLYLARKLWGAPKGADDIQEVKWVNLLDVVEGRTKVIDCHKHLIQAVYESVCERQTDKQYEMALEDTQAEF